MFPILILFQYNISEMKANSLAQCYIMRAVFTFNNELAFGGKIMNDGKEYEEMKEISEYIRLDSKRYDNLLSGEDS